MVSRLRFLTSHKRKDVGEGLAQSRCSQLVLLGDVHGHEPGQGLALVRGGHAAPLGQVVHDPVVLAHPVPVQGRGWDRLGGLLVGLWIDAHQGHEVLEVRDDAPRAANGPLGGLALDVLLQGLVQAKITGAGGGADRGSLGGANKTGTKRRYWIAVVAPGPPLFNAEALNTGLEQFSGQEGVVLRMGLEVQPLGLQQLLGLLEGHAVVPGRQPFGGVALQVSKEFLVGLHGLLGDGLAGRGAGFLGCGQSLMQ